MRQPMLTLVLVTAACGAQAGAPADLQTTFAAQARQERADFSGFSAERGKDFFNTVHARDWSCASCHTENPSARGRHATTGKPIDPLAPAANPERFTRADKVEKWFKRNCNDVLGRPCTAREKGDVLAYLLTVR
jgi:hypothetical protein